MTTSHQERPAPQLAPPGIDHSMRGYVARMWDLRHYANLLARLRVENATAETRLGRLWTVIEPLLMVAVYAVIFGWVLGADRGVENFVAFLATGQIIYRFHASSIQDAAGSTVTFERVIQGFPVPRAIFPLTASLASLYRYFGGIVIMLLIVVGTGERPLLSWLFLPLIVVGQFLLNAGVGLFLARAVAHVRDIQNLLQHIFRIIFYASGVVFLVEAFLIDRESGPTLLKLLAVLNPIYDSLQLMRWAVLGTRPAFAEWLMVAGAVWALLTPILGLIWFRRVEQRYGFGLIRNAP